MPTIFTHSVVGLSAATALSGRKFPARFWGLSLLCAVLPDADVVTFRLGIPYEHFLGHRGFFHSLLFAILVGFLIALLFFPQEKLFSKKWFFYLLYFSGLTATHGILDAFTNGGLGIALLSPFDNQRYFFWTTPIQVSPLSPDRFFTARGLAVIKNELLWLWLPCMLLALFTRLYRRR